MAVTVLVDAENVRRSRWPNLSQLELVERARTWGAATGRAVVLVFDRAAPVQANDVVGASGGADDWLAQHAAEYEPFWLVTSDRELRRRTGGSAERVVGGGAFLAELLGQTPAAQ